MYLALILAALVVCVRAAALPIIVQGGLHQSTSRSRRIGAPRQERTASDEAKTYSALAIPGAFAAVGLGSMIACAIRPSLCKYAEEAASGSSKATTPDLASLVAPSTRINDAALELESQRLIDPARHVHSTAYPGALSYTSLDHTRFHTPRSSGLDAAHSKQAQ